MTAKTNKDLRKTEVHNNKIREDSFADRLLGFAVITLSVLIFLINIIMTLIYNRALRQEA